MILAVPSPPDRTGKEAYADRQALGARGLTMNLIFGLLVKIARAGVGRRAGQALLSAELIGRKSL